jgi:uncharacterized protein with GYD domain
VGAREKIIGYVLVNTDIGQEHDVAKKILSECNLKGSIKEVVVTYGIHDMVVKFEISSFKDSNDIVTCIREIPGVRKTETLLGFPAGP